MSYVCSIQGPPRYGLRPVGQQQIPSDYYTGGCTLGGTLSDLVASRKYRKLGDAFSSTFIFGEILSAHFDFSLPTACHPCFFKATAPTRIHGIGQEFPCVANRVVRVTIEDIRTSLRVSLNNCRNIAEQPCLSLFDGQTKAGSWPRMDRAQHGNQLPPKLLPALVVEIADDDHRPRISSGIRAPVRAQHAWQVLKKGMYPRVGRLREVFGYPTDSLKRNHLKRNLPADDTWNQFVEHSLAGLVLDQNFKVHPVEPRQGNRCTTGLPAATLRPPSCLLSNRHWRA